MTFIASKGLVTAFQKCYDKPVKARAVSLIKKMRIYSGYRLNTEKASYAWMDLDSVKLCKLDAVSEMEVRKSGKKLELLLGEGNLFFNVTEPLDDDETLNIRTSTMTVGIRGTCGWVRAIDQWTSQIYVLEGAVQTSVADPVTGEIKSETISAGESAVCKVYTQDQEGDKCEIIHDTYSEAEIDGFVLTEAVADEALCDRIYEGSGLDLRDYPGDPVDRLRQDQASVGEKLVEIEDQADSQDSHISTDPVWSDPIPAPAPTGAPPSPPAIGGGSSGGSESGGDSESGGGSVTGGGSATGGSETGGSETGSSETGGGDSGTPEPVDPSGSVTLTMPRTGDEINAYLSQSDVTRVEVQADTPGELTVDSGLTVPAWKTLVLDGNIATSIDPGQTLTVIGTMNNQGGLTNNGKLTVTSPNTLQVGKDLVNNGTLEVTATGVVVVDGTLSSNTSSSVLSPELGAVIQAKEFQLDGGSAPSWNVFPGSSYDTLNAKFTIFFDANAEGVASPTNRTTNVDRTLGYFLPARPVRTGYFFDGWYTEKTDGIKVEEGTAFRQDATLYAKWSLDRLSLRVEGDTMYISVKYFVKCRKTLCNSAIPRIS